MWFVLRSACYAVLWAAAGTTLPFSRYFVVLVAMVAYGVVCEIQVREEERAR